MKTNDWRKAVVKTLIPVRIFPRGMHDGYFVDIATTNDEALNDILAIYRRDNCNMEYIHLTKDRVKVYYDF